MADPDNAEWDPAAPNARRFPRVITPDEIEKIPRLEFNTGINTSIFLSRERDDARYFRQGYCYMEPDHAGYSWHQSDFDETHYVLEGKITLTVRDAAGREITLEAGQGEHIYCPAGYSYTISANGVRGIFFWTSGPSPRAGLVEAKDYSNALKALRS